MSPTNPLYGLGLSAVVLQDLEGQHGVARARLYLPLRLHRSVAMDDEQRDTRQPRRDQDKRKEKLGAQSQAGPALQNPLDGADQASYTRSQWQFHWVQI